MSSLLQVKNLDQVNSDLDRFMAQVRADAQNSVKALVARSIDWLASQSPQYSGDFAANWKVAVGSSMPQFQPQILGANPDPRGSSIPRYAAGDRAAVSVAVRNATLEMESYKLGQELRIVNNAYHDEPYAILIEHGQIRFRPENAGYGAVLSRFIGMISSGGFPA